MIIDFRSRIDAWSESERHSLADHSAAHEAAMRCVDASVIHGYRSELLQAHAPAQNIAALVNEDPDHRLGFAGIDPMRDSAIGEVDEAVDLGLVGVTIAPADQGCRATSDRCMRLLEHCAARSLPVHVANPLLTNPRSVVEFADPVTLDEPLRTIPGLTIVLGDLGHAWLASSLLLIARHENAYAEISALAPKPWELHTALLMAYERDVIEKLLFASGFPTECPEPLLERLFSFSNPRSGANVPCIPRRALQDMVQRDTLGRLGIDQIVIRRTEDTPSGVLAPVAPLPDEPDLQNSGAGHSF